MITSLIIHHSADLDGYGSAAVAINYLESQKFYIKTKTIPINYNVYNFEKIKEIIDEINSQSYLWIFVLDFSLSTEEMKWMIDNCNKFFWCDHHPTVQDTVENVTNYIKSNGEKIYNRAVINNRKKNYFFNFNFDNDKAAILLTHEMLYNTEANNYIKYISNLDLWKIDDPNIIYFREFIHSFPWKNYKRLKQFIFTGKLDKNSTASKEEMEQLIQLVGRVFIEKKKEQIDKIKTRFKSGKLENYKICIINNTNAEINSEMLNQMCQQGYDVAISYFDDLVNNVRGFSLRSVEDNIIVNKIAKKYGGGGHPKAAGFSLSIDEGHEFVKKMIGRRND